MKSTKTNIEGLIILEPTILKDNRGLFFESFNKKNISELIGNVNFVQENESFSKKGVLRGLHFQNPPHTQSKLVRCLAGKILDLAVDLRSNSKTFGQYSSVLLSGENKKMLFIPKGFAHGFFVLSDNATISYKLDNYYKPTHSGGIIWNDDTLNIDWMIGNERIILSEKDKNLPSLKQFSNPF